MVAVELLAEDIDPVKRLLCLMPTRAFSESRWFVCEAVRVHILILR
jgi:hypothetical protein